MRVLAALFFLAAAAANAYMVHQVWTQIQIWDDDPVMRSIGYSAAYGFLAAFLVLSGLSLAGAVAIVSGKWRV